jgi:NAD(P)-dependent dehydrogenase (short-subunit alcohol dehydrogenase family)
MDEAVFTVPVIAITGASDGLGRALALELAAPGVRLALNGRRPDRLASVARDVAARGAQVLTVAGHVGDGAFADRLLATVGAEWGDITHLVTNASSLGTVPLRPMADVDDAGWEDAIATNLLGTVRLWRGVLPAMEERLGGGRLVAISSDAAVTPYAHWGPYGATKAAVDHLVAILAEEFREHAVHGVDVYAVDPGDMDTAMHRAALPDDDPATLRDPQASAVPIADLLMGPSRLPSGRYTVDDLTHRLREVHG